MRQAEHIKAVDQVVTPNYAIYQGDSCELIRAVPGDSIHFGIHSRPSKGSINSPTSTGTYRTTKAQPSGSTIPS
jgi:hypothetical protein